MEEFAIAFGGIGVASLDGADGFVVEDAADGDGADAAVFHDVDDVFCFTGTAVCDDGYADGGGHSAAEFEVEAFSGSFAIDGGCEDFTGAEFFSSGGPLECIDTSVFATVIGEGEPGTVGLFSGFDGDDDGGGSEASGGFADEFGVIDGGSVDGDFVGTCREYCADIFE